MQDKRLSLLSIAAKAGFIRSGSFAAMESIRSGEAKLVIISEDASENTKKKFTDKSNHYKVRYLICGMMDELGRLIGKDERSVLVVTDSGAGDVMKVNVPVQTALEGGQSSMVTCTIPAEYVDSGKKEWTEISVSSNLKYQ